MQITSWEKENNLLTIKGNYERFPKTEDIKLHFTDIAENKVPTVKILLNKYVQEHKTLELGFISLILKLTAGRTGESIKIFQSFKQYIEHTIGKNFIKAIATSKENLDEKIDMIRIRCRNGAAHTEFIYYLELDELFALAVEAINFLTNLTKN